MKLEYIEAQNKEYAIWLFGSFLLGEFEFRIFFMMNGLESETPYALLSINYTLQVVGKKFLQNSETTAQLGWDSKIETKR